VISSLRLHTPRWGAVLTLSAATLLASLGQAAWAQKVRLSTSRGDIVLDLNHDKAPKTVDNFIQYVKAGHYDGTIFHRVIPTFMIQGGGMLPDMSEKPTRAPIALESRNGLKNVRGSIAMARTMVPDSATSQFFINVVDNPMLDQPNAQDHEGYAVFGQVISGMAVVDAIRAVPTGRRGMHSDVPTEPIIIKKAQIEN